MTTELFQTDSYLKSCTATVTRTREGAVCLDQTAFYPGGGGQPHDLGVLEAGGQTLVVTKVKKEADGIWHWIDGPAPAAGTQADCTIDWERRYKLMRTHTALHILCGVIWRDYGAQVTGGNMEPGSGRLDFEFDKLEADLIGEIQEKVNTEVKNARDVRVKILPREQALEIPDLIRTKVNLLPPQLTRIRTVEIVGLDLQADGGTHVANTREIGTIRIVDYKSKGRINKRIRIAVEP